MIARFRFARHRRWCGPPARFAGVTFVIVAVGFQFAYADESTMRILGSRQQLTPPVANNTAGKRETVARRDSVGQRESTVRVATATSSVLGRQESKLVERRSTQTGTQQEEFTQAIRQAAAPRGSIDVVSPNAVAPRETCAVATRKAPPANISALTITKAPSAPAPAASVPSPRTTASVPIIRITTPAAGAESSSEPAPTPVGHNAQRVAAAPSRKMNSPAPVASAHAAAPVVKAQEAAVPAPSLVVSAPAPFVPAPSPVVRAPAPSVPAPSPVVSAPAPIALAPTPVFAAPEPALPAPLPVAQAPAPAIDEPVRIAQAPSHPAKSAVSKTPPVRTADPPVASIAAAHATYHPHSKPAPPTNGCEAADTCHAGPEEYVLPNAPDCVYGPGQSGAQFVCGVDCGAHGAPCVAGWHSTHCIPWSLFGPGEYVGPSRSEHVSNYFLRVNDLLTLTYINSRQISGERYQLGIGDRLQIESSLDESLKREVQIQPDGEITLPIVGEVMAAGKTVKELRNDLTEVFKEAQRDPQITVTPVLINAGQAEIIRAITAVSGSNGQALDLKVTPEGTIQVPGIGSVYVQGLTLEELRSELEARYASTFGSGLMISPSLTERAVSYVFIGGEVKAPNRYTLEGPTTATQAVSSLAGGWNVGGNLHQVVVFRRDENWCLKAIKIDIRAPLYGRDPCPVNDVWLRDNDLVLVPKSKILCATDVINLYMTRGVYAAFPVSFFQDLSSGSSVSTVVPAPPGP